MIENLRIGSVPYLNAKPLVRHLPEGVRLLEPSLLAQEFRQGLFDVALIPVVECFLEEKVRIIDGLAIACQGSVYSVILAHQKPLHELKSISLDAASLTSATLLKVLLRRYWKIQPELLPDGIAGEGQLLIGDRALKFRKEFPQVMVTDLGLAWRSYTGLPFVFAVWAISPHSKLCAEQINEFRQFSLKGLADRKIIATSVEEYRYLTESIRFDLGLFEKEALKRFCSEIKDLSLFSRAVISQPQFV